MKPEPLKDKIQMCKICHKYGDCFNFFDVKSAVEWLLKEIEKEFKEWGNNDDWIEIDKENWIVFKNEIKTLIKKAFEDVIKNG